jgi:hypothetical protein
MAQKSMLESVKREIVKTFPYVERALLSCDES